MRLRNNILNNRSVVRFWLLTVAVLVLYDLTPRIINNRGLPAIGRKPSLVRGMSVGMIMPAAYLMVKSAINPFMRRMIKV